MKTSVTYKIIQFFKLIGLVPLSTSYKLFNVFTAGIVLALLSFSCYFYIIHHEDKFLAAEIILYDITYSMAGIGSVVMNYKLYNNFTDIFVNKLIKLPNKLPLLVISIVFYIFSVILYFKTSVDLNEMTVLNFFSEQIVIFIAQIQKLSFTFLFGSIVKFFEICISDVENDIISGFDKSLKDYLDNYYDLKNVISYGLFFIFCCETFNLTFFLYFFIKLILKGDIYYLLAIASWNINNICVLVYIALIADDGNNICLKLTDNLW